MEAIRGRQYHREDLRGELMKAGRAYITAHGHMALSIRTLAQTVGVSPAAPYHHFKDRRALLLALALDGYAQLFAGARLLPRKSPDPEQTLIALSLVFLDFAAENPRMLELMYESELTKPDVEPAVRAYQQTGQEALTAPLKAALPGHDEAELGLKVLMLWSAVYGLAFLREKQVVGSFFRSELDRALVVRAVTLAVGAALRS